MQKLLAMMVCWCWLAQVTAQPNIVAAEYFIDTDPGVGNATSIPITTPSANIINHAFSVALGTVPHGIHALFIRSKSAAGKWSVANRFVFYKPPSTTTTTAANINKAEYFFDTDPGFGNAINIPVTPGLDVQNVNFAASLSSLSAGVHSLYIRSSSVDGKWSITNRQVVYKPTSTVTGAASNIVKAEYFFDTDPGFGNASNIPVTPGLDVQNVNFNTDLAALSVGVHTLFIRSRNADGKWSISNRQVLYKPNPVSASAARNIVKAEYFFDTDPGFGNATNIPIAPGIDVQNVNFAADISALTTGVHQFFIRSQSATGKWSITNRFIMYKPDPANSMPPGDITNVEYFIDTDPGFGNAVPVVVNPVASIEDFVTPINISGLSVGDHKLFIRSRTNSGYSVTNVYTFPIASTAALPHINVNAITKKVMCAKDSVKISFDAKGMYNTGNEFRVELSNASGSFASPVVIGTYTGTNSAIIACKLPDNVVGGTNFRVRVSSTNPVVTGASGSDALTIGNRSQPQTITGPIIVNGNLNYAYNVPAVTGSTWNWMIASGAKTSGGTTNNIGITWSQPSSTTSIGTINLVETNYGCEGDTSRLTATIYKLRIGLTAPVSACKAFDITINASADGAFATGNALTAQLSNATGSFAAPVSIGSVALVGNGLNQAAVINAAIPFNTPNGTGYRVRLVSNTGNFVGDTSANISIVKPNIGADITRSKCVGFTYDIRQDFIDAALSYAYFTQSFGNLASPDGVDAGIYQVIATNSIGCKDTAMITVNNFPKPNLGPDQTISKCPVETVNLPSLFTTTGLTSEWNVAIPSSVQTPGTYRLIVTNSNGCKDTAFVTVSNYPKPDIGPDKTISKCPVETVNLPGLFTTNGLTSEWNVALPSFVQASGTYRLIVTNANGCKDTAFVTVSNYDKPNLGADKIVSKCIGFTTDISGLFTTTGLTTEWNTPTPSAVEAGMYRLIVTNSNGCKDTAFVTVSNYDKPNLGADKTVSKCIGFTTDISGLFTTPGLTTEWNTPTPSAVDAGTYRLIVTNTNGCKDTVSVTVSNYDKPNLGADKTVSKCIGFTTDISGLFTTTGLMVEWNTPTPSAVDAGMYRLIVTNSNGCKDTAFVTVSNYDKPNLGADKTVSKCIGFTTDISGLFTTPGLTTEWNTPTPSAVDAGTFRLIVTNSNGCKDTAFVTVSNYPKPNLGADKSITVACANGTADITNVFNTAGLTPVYNTPTPATAMPGQYTLIVTNANGCKDTALITVLEAPVSTVPTQPTLTKMASRECTDADGWTHYYNDNGTPTDAGDDIRILSVKKNGNNIGTVGNGTFELKVVATAGAGSGTSVKVNSPLVTSGNDFYSMNRYWTIKPTSQPTTPVAIRFYYNTADLADVNGNYPNGPIDHPAISLYKVTGENADPTSGWENATAVFFYSSDGSPSLTTWQYTSLGDNTHQAEFLTNSFSGGGAGAKVMQTLPITLTQFTAKAENDKVALTWSTSSEINTKAFIVHRSLDGRSFEAIGTVNAAGNSNQLHSYSFADRQAMQYTGRLVYYRLLQTDRDGLQKFTEVKTVRIAKGGNLLSLQFNPVRGQAVLNYVSQSEGKVSIRITDLAGRTIYIRQQAVVTGANQFRLSTASLAQGIYLVSVTTANDRQVVRMMKE